MKKLNDSGVGNIERSLKLSPEPHKCSVGKIYLEIWLLLSPINFNGLFIQIGTVSLNVLERLCLWTLAQGSEIVLSYFGEGLSAPALVEQSHPGPFYCSPNHDVCQGSSTEGQGGQMHTDSKTCFIHGPSQQITSMIWHFICLLRHSYRQQRELCFPLLSPSVTSKVRGERERMGVFSRNSWLRCLSWWGSSV